MQNIKISLVPSSGKKYLLRNVVNLLYKFCSLFHHIFYLITNTDCANSSQ